MYHNNVFCKTAIEVHFKIKYHVLQALVSIHATVKTNMHEKIQ